MDKFLCVEGGTVNELIGQQIDQSLLKIIRNNKVTQGYTTQPSFCMKLFCTALRPALSLKVRRYDFNGCILIVTH